VAAETINLSHFSFATERNIWSVSYLRSFPGTGQSWASPWSFKPMVTA